MSKDQQKKESWISRAKTAISINQAQSQMGSVPAFEDIQKRAYQIYEEKGGSDFENWLEAERVLKEGH